MSRLKKSIAATLLTLPPNAAMAQQVPQSPTVTQTASVVTAEHEPPKNAPLDLPDAPSALIARAATPSLPAKPEGFFGHAEHIADAVQRIENKSHLSLELDPNKVGLELPLKTSHGYDRPNSSLDEMGLTHGPKNGFTGGWDADLFARQTTGNGPLQPKDPDRSYGGEIEGHANVTKGPFSMGGRAIIAGGQEQFPVHLSPFQMSEQLAKQNVPPEYLPEATAELKAGLPGRTNQPLVTGTVSTVAEFDPKHTSMKLGPFDAGLVSVGAGFDRAYRSLGNAEQHEVYATGLRSLDDSVAVGAYYAGGHASGYDAPVVETGVHGYVAVKPTELMKGIKQEIVGRHTANAARNTTSPDNNTRGGGK